MGAKVQIDVVGETTNPFCNLYSLPSAFPNSGSENGELSVGKGI